MPLFSCPGAGWPEVLPSRRGRCGHLWLLNLPKRMLNGKDEPHEMAAQLLGGLGQELVYKADLPGSRVGV